MRRLLSDIYWVFWREMKHFFQERVRILMSIVQPMLWLVLMGNGIAGLTRNPAAIQMLGTANYLTFMTPGVIIMTALFSGSFGGLTILWDRRLGFLNKLLAAPIYRASIPIGKLMWLVVQGLIQMSVILVVAMLMGVHVAAGIPGILVIMLQGSLFMLIMGGISVSLAARIKTMDTLFAITNFLTLPLMFTSNALFPTQAMPQWLQVVASVNPLTYAVDPMRTVVTQGWVWENIWGGILVLMVMAIISVFVAVRMFDRPVI